jgi:5-hydroxyisourate hydrolase
MEKEMKSPITTHVLDITKGKPAAGVRVGLEIQRADGMWEELGRGVTNSDGRCGELLSEDFNLAVGAYRLTFLTGDYYRLMNVESFYPRIVVEFVVANGGHYHVPVLLSPFGYSTYRGS